MGTSIQQDDPMLRLQYYRETGQADEAKHFEQYLRETGQYHEQAASPATLPMPHFAGESTRALPTDYSRQGDLSKLGQGIAANVVNVATAIPGTMALASGIRALGRREPYRDAYNDLQAAKQGIPGPIRTAEDFIGQAPLALIPGSPAVVGAASAAASHLLDANPDRGLKSRAIGAAIAAPVGAAAGKVLDMGVTRGRSDLTPTLGDQQVAREAKIESLDKTLYGDAGAESRAAGMVPNVTPKLNAALQDESVQSYLKLALEDPENAKASPGEVLMHASRLMSRDARSIGDRIAQKGEYDAILATQASKLNFAKQKLDQAIAEIAPTFPVANAMHAAAKGEMQTMKNASDVANRVFQGQHVSGKKLSTQAQEVFLRDVQNLSPNNKAAAVQGILGRQKEYPILARTRLFGTDLPAPFPNAAIRRAPGLVRSVNAPNQGMVDFLTKLGLVGTNGAVNQP